MKARSVIYEKCQKNIQKKLRLRSPPKIVIVTRKFERMDRRGNYYLPKHRIFVDESAEWIRKSDFHNPIRKFNEEYYCFPHCTRKGTYNIFLMEPLVRLGDVILSGGLNWIIMGRLINDEYYAAIMDVEVRPIFRRCGLMTLMTLEEIALAKQNGCDFIHIIHGYDNPNILGAVIPELRAGFILYRGSSNNCEGYNDTDCMHLRYYLDRKKRRDIKVTFKDGTVLESPHRNSTIIRYLKKYDYLWEQIIDIEKYENLSECS